MKIKARCAARAPGLLFPKFDQRFLPSGTRHASLEGLLASMAVFCRWTPGDGLLVEILRVEDPFWASGQADAKLPGPILVCRCHL